MTTMPKEIDFIGIYLPPGLVVGIVAFFAALGTAMLLNHFRLTRFIAAPPVFFLAMIAVYYVVASTFIIPV
jgi:hypothetical protein